MKEPIREVESIIRRHRLSYSQVSYVVKQARRSLGIKTERPAKRLPKNLTGEELQTFFNSVELAGNATTMLLFRLLYATGVRVSELTGMERRDVDLHARTIRVNLGKGGKDRVVPFPEELLLSLRLHLNQAQDNKFLFESRRRQRLSSRWIQLLCARYGAAAGIEAMHPHRLRHSLITNLTRKGLTDAQIQLISGHSSKKSLECYQSLGLRDVHADYSKALGS
jgi:integrase/recombinase XerD